MFSWFNKDGNEDKENDSNDLQQSIFEENEESKTASHEDTLIPTPQHYPLHAVIIQKDAAALIKHIKNLPSFDPLLPDKTRPINAKDHHGYTPLHLCVLLSWEEGLDILIKNGASTTVRSRSGWTALQECVSTSQRELLRKLFERNMEEVREGLALRSPIIRRKLCEKDDFYVEIDWKFSSWIPFVSRFCPCDTFKIWKRGSDFRLDMSLVDFESFSWKRGHISFIFIMNKKTDKAEFYVLNHDKKTKEVTNKQKELEESKNDTEIADNIEQLLQSEVVSPEIFTNKIEISKSKSWMGYEKLTEVNGQKCTLYELKNLIVLANKRDSHVPKEVKEQRALTKQLWQSKVEASKKGEDVEFDMESIEDHQWQCPKCSHLNEAQYVFCEQCTTNKPGSDQTDDNDQNKDQNQEDKDGDIKVVDKATKPSKKSAISSLFGEIKKYDYPQYVPPTITMDEYFDIEEWQKHKMDIMSNKMKKKKIKATTEAMDERKETFIINPAPSTMSTKSFKLHLAMTEHFGLTIEEILAILEAAAPQSKLAAKLKEFLEIKMPRGFPIQLEMPLFHILKATVTFQNYEHINPEDSIFHIPDDYKLVDKCDNDKE